MRSTKIWYIFVISVVHITAECKLLLKYVLAAFHYIEFCHIKCLFWKFEIKNYNSNSYYNDSGKVYWLWRKITLDIILSIMWQEKRNLNLLSHLWYKKHWIWTDFQLPYNVYRSSWKNTLGVLNEAHTCIANSFLLDL